MTGVIKSLCISMFIVSCCSAKNLPSFIQKCKLTYPEVNECILKRVSELKPHLEKGIPEMKVPALKPLRIPKAEIHTGDRSSTGFSASFNDIVIVGAEDFEMKNLDFNVEKQFADMHIYIPKLRIQSTYAFNGKILILELSGTGAADANITNINSKSHSNLRMVTKNGKQYISVGDNPSSISYDKPSLRFEDLFKGNPELTEHTNQVINENIIEIEKEIKPLIDDTIHTFVYGIINRIFNEYSVDELFD